MRVSLFSLGASHRSKWCGGTKIDGTKAHQAPGGAAAGSRAWFRPAAAAGLGGGDRRGRLPPRQSPVAKNRVFARPVPGRAAPR